MKKLRLSVSDGPTYWLHKYKTTQRPRPCGVCEENAYYYHPDWHYLCAAHLLDLINIGGTLFSWEDYPEMWNRTERLLQRSTSATATTDAQSDTETVTDNKRLDT